MKNPHFGSYYGDDYTDACDRNWDPRGTQGSMVPPGTSPVETLAIQRLTMTPELPSLVISKDYLYLAGCTSLDCPVSTVDLDIASDLFCPDDGGTCPFFVLPTYRYPGFIKLPRKWGFLTDFTAEVKWIHPSPQCMGRARDELCAGLNPTCEPYQAVNEHQRLEGFKPFGCRAYAKCQTGWVKVARFPACIERELRQRAATGFWTGRPEKMVAAR